MNSDISMAMMCASNINTDTDIIIVNMINKLTVLTLTYHIHACEWHKV